MGIDGGVWVRVGGRDPFVIIKTDISKLIRSVKVYLSYYVMYRKTLVEESAVYYENSKYVPYRT